MQFEIDRTKIDELKNISNYKKTYICQGTSADMWGRWIKDIHSPSIRTLEEVSKHSELNTAELVIAILELRREYLEKQSSASLFERQVEDMSEEESKKLLIKLFKQITDPSASSMDSIKCDFDKYLFVDPSLK